MKLFGLIETSLRPARDGSFGQSWSPPADVYQAPWGWLVKFDLAGVRLEDVHLSVEGRRMMLSGMRKDTVSEQGCCHYRLEIAYNRFERTLEFPCRLDGARIGTELRDGMLLVRVQLEESR